ncbi:lipoate--protein ligase family protein [Falsarthrobacter nasiphocae]|uniref:Lipoate-protein ligase A n=1 Tax=Falsarthrobacter nasiphocae TaxID=189863 RepID=A0AAE3YFG7_9MICC|nr:lipoate--protein ligase family protein [Falsarthrobacter nasiphocae]MDR6891184.1 lipoate-protein ligase A [Falsarthrobacter nasiphocae]
MPSPELRVILPHESLGAAEDLEGGLRLLSEVRDGSLGAHLRLYRPVPTLAFGQRDVRLPGFQRATTAAGAHGFTPVVRKAGGRAAAYHRGTLVVDHVEREAEAMLGHQARFIRFGDLFVRALGRLGVEAAVGEIPGEYCAGEHSVHGRTPDGTLIKLAGTAQRVVQGAWFFSSVVVVENSAPLRAVLADVYPALGVEMEPSTVGAAEDTGVAGVTVEAFTEALLAEYGQEYRLTGEAPA